jgi:hypothetical protein
MTRKEPLMSSEAYMEQVRAVIEEKGWAIQGTYSTMGTKSAASSYAYTIGLIQRGCVAEVLISGLPIKLSSELLNEIAVAMTENSGMPPTQWDVSGGKGECLMVPVWFTKPTEEMSVSVARRYYNLPTISVVQYVWPAGNGTYPWDAEWPNTFHQPVGGIGRPTP